MAGERCGKYDAHHVYHPEIIRTRSMGRLQKIHWNTMNACL